MDSKEAAKILQEEPDALITPEKLVEVLSDENLFCSLCDNEATSVVARSAAPLCSTCSEAYELGQSNPGGQVLDL